MLFGPGHCTGVKAPIEVSYTNMSLSFIFMLFTIPGNVLVILAIVINPHKNLRSPFILLILNLAITDLIVGSLVEPLSVYIHSREARGLTINMAWLSQTAYFLCCTASLFSLAVLTVDRYLAIAHAVWYRVNASNKRVAYASIAIWCLSIGCTSIFFEVGFISYAFVFANLTILSTFIIFVFTYVQVFNVLKKQLANLGEMHDGSANELERAQRRSILWEKRVTKTYLIVLAVFLACYFPSCLMIYLMNMCETCSCDLIHWFRDLQFILVTINSLSNPFIYAFRLRNLRRAVFTVLQPLRCCISNRVDVAHPTDSTQRELRGKVTSVISVENLPKPIDSIAIARHSPEFSASQG